MQWDSSRTAGFTAENVTPWLPVGDAADCNVAAQRDDPASVLSLCRSLLRVRSLARGADPADPPGSDPPAAATLGVPVSYELLHADDRLWAYHADGLIVAGNFSDDPVELPFPTGELLLRTGSAPPVGQLLGPWEGVVAHPAT